MKVLFVGDSPTIATGFSRCTREACDALISRGHEVVVLGMAYYGDPHDYPYEIWPCYAPLDQAKSYGGEARLASMIARVKPDVVVILQDPWNIPPYFECLDAVSEKCKEQNIEFNIPPVIGWLAVDSKNQKGEQLERLAHIMVWTEFARQEFLIALEAEKEAITKYHDQLGLATDQVYQLQKAAALNRVYHGAIDIVPLGVDTSLFYPRDKRESRTVLGFDQLGIPQDAFIVGVVGRNQTRKRLELTLDYFAAWIERYNVSDAYLYLHVAPTGEASCDLKSLVRHFKLGGKVIVHTPEVGAGDDDARMPFVYSAMNVYMTQSQGEGWGLPALEAMACGVECVLPDHSAFGALGWAETDCAYRVPCSGVALTAPQNKNPYTVGAIADKEMTVIALDTYYKESKLEMGDLFNYQGVQLAQRLTWQNTGALFVDSLERFMRERSEMCYLLDEHSILEPVNG